MKNTVQFRYFHLWNAIGWLLIGLVFYLSLTPSPPKIVEFQSVDKIEHVLAYLTLMFWFSQLYVSRNAGIVWALFFVSMGISLEILQGLGGRRYFEYFDMLANTTGVLIGWWLSRGWCSGLLYRLDLALSQK